MFFAAAGRVRQPELSRERLLQTDPVQIPRLPPLTRDEGEPRVTDSSAAIDDASEDDDADTPIDGVPATTG